MQLCYLYSSFPPKCLAASIDKLSSYFCIPRVNPNIRIRHFPVAASAFWNLLPDNVKSENIIILTFFNIDLNDVAELQRVHHCLARVSSFFSLGTTSSISIRYRVIVVLS